MLVVTTENVAGHSVLELKRQCFGVVVRSRGLGGNVMAGLRSIVGGEIHEFRRAHPTTLVLKEREGRLVAERAADTPIDEPLVFDEAQTYTGGPTPLTADAHLPVDPFAAANSLRADGRRVRPRLCA